MGTISRAGITSGGTIQSSHITNIIDALDGTSTTTTVVATGSFSGSLVGALTGTASFATTALSASYAGNVPVTASYALSALSSSYAVTASFALNAGGGTGVGFPFTGSAQVTGSMGITGSLEVTGGVTASLQGTASHATSIGVVRTNINATYYPTFVDSSNAATGSEQLYTAANIAFNPNRGSIQALSISGSLTGSLFGTASFATSASFAADTTTQYATLTFFHNEVTHNAQTKYFGGVPVAPTNASSYIGIIAPFKSVITSAGISVFTSTTDAGSTVAPYLYVNDVSITQLAQSFTLNTAYQAATASLSTLVQKGDQITIQLQEGGGGAAVYATNVNLILKSSV